LDLLPGDSNFIGKISETFLMYYLPAVAISVEKYDVFSEIYEI
jgi:hypothetical protein